MTLMEVAETQPTTNYASGPPWLFRGSALYQLHLVKAEMARAFIPKELKLVEAFGYTLGGFFFARYDDSPAGKFDELVVISGIVWNPPTSCAWASRVLVNSQEACQHGRKEIGLPSQLAMFSEPKERFSRSINKPSSKSSGYLDILGVGSAFHNSPVHTEIQVCEFNGSSTEALCNINLPFAVSETMNNEKWVGPMVRMSLPSFSGKTRYNHNLLKYSCQIECRVQSIRPATVSRPVDDNRKGFLDQQKSENDNTDGSCLEHDAWKHCVSVLLSKPILALKFNFLRMKVDAPCVVNPHSKAAGVGGSSC